MKKVVLLTLFGLLLALLPRGEVARGQAGGASQPTLTVYLQQDRLREGEDLPVVVWLSNELPQEIHDLRLAVDAPALLAWWDGGRILATRTGSNINFSVPPPSQSACSAPGEKIAATPHIAPSLHRPGSGLPTAPH